ncbi:RagB/SusD family nutrient uptake outer membrane protein [Pedobacter sp. GR22-6]|uniref:RagB/SusD family nutrient uptake outer membrane protein n=1 Tax=Pedobacter sp. GR22-6 TaxID=3127957 RepID=UPI00307F2EA3
MRISKIYLLGLLITVINASCGKDFLEVAPKGSLIASRTVEYENMMYNSLALGADVPTVALGDDAAMLSTYFESSPLRLQRIFRWDKDFYEPEQTAAELQSPISSIYIYNKIINEVMDSKEGDEAYKLRIRAEAKASRAYFNMLLINYYGKPFNPATAATDPGIPLVKEADVSATSFGRVSVKEVYDNMISDLTDAIPMIPVNQPHRQRMTKAAAEFTLAKLYWYQGDYTAALNWIKEGKAHLPTSFEVGIYDYNVTYAVPTWTVTSGFNNIESLLARTSLSFWVNTSNSVLLAPWAFDLYTASDKRLKSFSSVPYQGTGTFPARLNRRTGPFGAQVSQGVNLADVELMKAECEARLGQLAESKATLLAFRLKRMSNTEAPVNVAQKDDLIRFVIEERVREFALYGLRWFDMRRLSNDPLFQSATYKHIVFDGSTGLAKDTYTLEKDRLTLRFPLNVMSANPGMQNNP